MAILSCLLEISHFGPAPATGVWGGRVSEAPVGVLFHHSPSVSGFLTQESVFPHEWAQRLPTTGPLHVQFCLLGSSCLPPCLVLHIFQNSSPASFLQRSHPWPAFSCHRKERSLKYYSTQLWICVPYWPSYFYQLCSFLHSLVMGRIFSLQTQVWDT